MGEVEVCDPSDWPWPRGKKAAWKCHSGSGGFFFSFLLLLLVEEMSVKGCDADGWLLTGGSAVRVRQ